MKKRDFLKLSSAATAGLAFGARRTAYGFARSRRPERCAWR